MGENIIFRPSVTWKKDGKEEKKGGDDSKEKLKNMKVKCRICDGEHFTARCPFKDTMAPIGEGADAPDGAAGGSDDGQPKEGGLGAASGGYVPPHLRKGGAAGAGERMGGKYERDDLATLRVTNVCYLRAMVVLGVVLILSVPRSRSSLKRMIFERFLSASAALRESSLPKTGRQVVRRALRSSASRRELMLQRLVRRLTAVSFKLPRCVGPSFGSFH